MKRFFRLIAVLSLLLLNGCKGYRDVQVSNVEIESLRILSTSKINLGLGVELDNPSKSTFELVGLEGVVYKDDTPLANVFLLEDAVIPSKYVGEVEVKCTMELIDPLAVLAMGLNVKSWDLDKFNLKLKATIKKGAIRKTFKVDDIPLEMLVDNISL